MTFGLVNPSARSHVCIAVCSMSLMEILVKEYFMVLYLFSTYSLVDNIFQSVKYASENALLCKIWGLEIQHYLYLMLPSKSDC